MYPSGVVFDQTLTLERLQEKCSLSDGHLVSDRFGDLPYMYKTEHQRGPVIIPTIQPKAFAPTLPESEDERKIQELKNILVLICNSEELTDEAKTQELFNQYTVDHLRTALRELMSAGTVIKNKGAGARTFRFGDKCTALLKVDRLFEGARDYVGFVQEAGEDDVVVSDDYAKLLALLDLAVRKKITVETVQVGGATPSDEVNTKVKLTLRESGTGEEEEEEEENGDASSPAVNHLKTFPKPWFDVEETFLPAEFARFATALLQIIFATPGITQETLVSRTAVILDSQTALALCEYLETTGTIAARVVYKSPGLITLFSPPVDISETPKPGYHKVISYHAKTNFFKELPGI